MERQVYCGQEIAWETGTGESEFAGSEKDNVGEPTGGGEARTGKSGGEGEPTGDGGEAIEAAKVNGICSIVKGAGLSTFLKYLSRLDCPC